MAKRELTPEEQYLYRYAIYHQHMHVESLIWCRQTLGYASPPTASRLPVEEVTSGPSQGDRDARVPAGEYPIGIVAEGADYATCGFGFDNEKPGFRVGIEAFRISKALVSNGEFLEFVAAGMYEKPEVWSYGGRHWLSSQEARHPVYWRCEEDGAWSERVFDAWQPLQLEAPIRHVSYWEAEAFARWAGRRLPTEFEWEAAARGQEGRLYPWGSAIPERRDAYLDMDGTGLGQGSVRGLPAGASPFGCLQLLGTVWEWTTSQFLPYAGFQVDMYPYMSTLQFGDHKVARGGSCATSSCLIRATYRQAYHPDRRDVFTGFRTCAR